MSETNLPAGLRVGVIGCGNMGGALARGIAAQPGHPEIFLFDRSAQVLTALSEATGATAVGSATEVAEAADLLVLAVKPDQLGGVLEKIHWPQRPRIALSVAAGPPLSWLRPLAPGSVAVVRAMPNMPATVGAGITAVLRHRDPAVHAGVCALLGACGQVVTIEREEIFNAVIGVSGSGPAYVFVAIEALADAGVSAGLPRATALHLATHTLLGSARLVAETGRHPAELKDAVASPGGTTIRALAALERGGFRAALIDAVEAGALRSQELANEFGE